MIYLENSIAQEATSSSQLSLDTIKYLNASLSKLSVTILKELYVSPKIQQKTLAANIHTSPSSLSNILSKLEIIQPQLIESKRVGRSKYYSLTEIAELYVVQELLPKTSKIHPFTPPQQADLTTDTLNILYLFQKTAGQDWEILFDDMLSKNTQSTINNSELQDLYMDFMNNITQLRTLQQTSSIHEIEAVLGNNILIKRLENHLNNTLTNFFIMEPLFKISKQNFEMAIQSIDYIFAEIFPDSFHKLTVSLAVPIDTLFSEQEYLRIFREFLKMSNEFNHYQGDKQKAIEDWKYKYCSTDLCLTYIAEKCYLIYALNQK